MGEVTITIPIRVDAWTNMRGAWQTQKRRKDREKQAMAWAVLGHVLPPLPALVVITRLAPRSLDDDNLPSATKYMRDELARAYGVSDAPGGPLSWRYEQKQTSIRDVVRYAVTFTITHQQKAS